MAGKKKISAEEFDAKAVAGEDITEHLDFDAAIKKVNVDFPVWMVNELDDEATRLGIARQAVIKMFVDAQLRQLKADRRSASDRRRGIA
jgi:membrane-bound lytic murein transglycosylase B